MRPLLSWLSVLLGLIAEPIAATPSLPLDVAQFVERGDLCEHFRQEEPYDQKRRVFLEKQIHKYCYGTDRELAALKRKYAAHAHVISKLNEYEAKIERR